MEAVSFNKEDLNSFDKPIMSKYSDKFSKWRPHQKEVVERIVNSNKRFILLRAPTGSGKSLIAVESALRIFGYGGEPFYYLVHTKDLQGQLLRDFKFFKSVKGRSNFKCNLFSGIKCSECPYQFVRQECPIKDKCSYYVHKRDAMNSLFVVWNYAMFLTNQTFVRDFDEVPFMVLDEAHLVEGVLMNFVKIEFSYEMFHEFGLNFPREENMFDRLDELYHLLKDRVERFRMNKMFDIVSGELRDIDKGEFKEAVKIERMIKKIKFFREMYDEETWITDYYYDRWNREQSKFVFKPIYVNSFSNLIFDWGYDKILMMSATLPPIDVISKSLGINVDDIEFIDVPSIFNRENRPVIFVPIGRMSYNYWEETVKRVVDWIAKFLVKHPDDKVLIHTANYKIARYIVSALEFFKKQETYSFEHEIMATERGDDEDRESLLTAFKESKYSAVLVSPVFETGVDLPDDSCRYQIIVKVPYPNLGDKQIKKRLENDRRWYLSMTANRLVQMAGRIVRSENDWGKTYVLDENFRNFVLNNTDLFPAWFLEAIAVEKEKEEKKEEEKEIKEM